MLRQELESAWQEFAEKYLDENDRLRPAGKPVGRDGADDFFEAIFNWPTLYLVGGSNELLERSKRAWKGITAQLEERGMFRDGFEIGYDWFHIGEGLQLFYNLCVACPDDTELRDAAVRFASLYLPDAPAGNYDGERNIVKTPHNGASGPRRGLEDGMSRFGTERAELRSYGLPIRGMEGITEWDDLAAPGNAERMASEMQRRFGSGDVAANLSVVSLVALTWLLTGEDRWRRWIDDYVDGWCDRADANGGLLPDNVGEDGVVGSAFAGSWYGGLYGWTWPHGIHSLLPSALNAGAGFLVTGSGGRGLDLARGVLAAVAEESIRAVPASRSMTMKGRWREHFGVDFDSEMMLWPTRYDKSGWFDYQPPQVAFPVWLWFLSRDRRDADALEGLMADCGWDWREVRQFRDKEEAGHEDAWFAAMMAGHAEEFATDALAMARRQVTGRLATLRSDDLTTGFDQDRWQKVNPVVTEVLVMTALGAPQALYNGGLQHTSVQYFDPVRGRPGLPVRAAALVESIDPDETSIQLVNLDEEPIAIVVQAGGFAEHRIVRATIEDFDGDTDPVPVAATPSQVQVAVPARGRVRLTMTLDRYGLRPRLGQGRVD